MKKEPWAVTRGARIRAAREKKNMTLRKLAQLIGVSPQAVAKWELGEVEQIKTGTFIKLCQELSVDPKHLIDPSGKNYLKGIEEFSDAMPMMVSEPNTRPYLKPFRYVPLISWVAAGNWDEIEDNHEPGNGDDWIPTSKKVSPNGFALRVKGDSMVNPKPPPTYPDGSTIVVDPHKIAKPGDRVVVKLLDTEEATFKQLVEDAGKTFLMPLNPAYPMIEITSEAHIVGVVVQTIIDE